MWLGSLPPVAAVPLIVASIALFVAGIALEGQFKIESDPLRWIDQESTAVTDVEILTEETGFETDRPLEDLGWVHPNPPIQTNRCHTFLARDVRLAGDQRPDEHEIIDVVRHPLSGVPDLFASGRITHALVLAAFQLLSVRGGA